MTGAVLFLLFGICFLVAGFVELANARKRRHWLVAEGTIITSEVRRNMGRYTSYRPKVGYEYIVDNETHFGNRIGFWYDQFTRRKVAELVDGYPVGARVVVYYQPGVPENAALRPCDERPSKTVLAIGGGCLFVGVMLMLAYFFGVNVH